MGSGAHGRLGTGDENSRWDPETVCSADLCDSGAIDVSAGEEHTPALLRDGTVLAWGENDQGRIGNEVRDRNATEPIEVPLEGSAVAVAAGGRHSIALMKNGAVWTWGHNNEGQLGTNRNETESWSPKKVTWSSDDPVVDVAAGYDFSLALTKNGRVYGWGSNGQGQLGQNDFQPVNKPAPVCAVRGCAAPLGDVQQIAAGWQHSMAIGRDGVVYAWGDNGYSELSGPSTDRRAKPASVLTAGSRTGFTGISAGWTYSLAVRVPADESEN